MKVFVKTVSQPYIEVETDRPEELLSRAQNPITDFTDINGISWVINSNYIESIHWNVNG